MENKAFWIGASLVFLSHVIAAVSQILLKKSAGNEYDVWWKEYMNPYVITAYSLFVVTTIITIFAMKYLPLSVSAALGASGQIIVPVLSYLVLHEKISKQRMTGMAIIVVGIFIFSL